MTNSEYYYKILVENKGGKEYERLVSSPVELLEDTQNLKEIIAKDIFFKIEEGDELEGDLVVEGINKEVFDEYFKNKDLVKIVLTNEKGYLEKEKREVKL